MALAAAGSPAGGGPSGTGIQRVAWLQGCWEAATEDGAIEEHWMAPRGTSMVGVGRTVRGGELVEYELMVLREEGERLAYQAHPSGQPAAVFLSDSVTEKAAVFQNPKHDYPKRIGYEREGPDKLLAWIDGGPDSERPRREFAYRRVSCAP
jgi:hypothetical protein